MLGWARKHGQSLSIFTNTHEGLMVCEGCGAEHHLWGGHGSPQYRRAGPQPIWGGSCWLHTGGCATAPGSRPALKPPSQGSPQLPQQVSLPGIKLKLCLPAQRSSPRTGTWPHARAQSQRLTMEATHTCPCRLAHVSFRPGLGGSISLQALLLQDSNEKRVGLTTAQQTLL